MSELKDFLKKKAEQAQLRKSVDWEARRQWWIARIDNLFIEIEQWLEPLRDDVVVVREYLEVEEEYLGKYNVEKMIISVGEEKVELLPFGTIVIGSYGRVDLVGDNGMIMLVLLDREIFPESRISFYSPKFGTEIFDENTIDHFGYLPENSGWFVFDKNSINKEYLPFNEESFASSLKSVMANVGA